MIVSGVLSLIFGLLHGLLDHVTVMTLPYSAMQYLGGFMSIGVWILGADIVTLFITSVLFWWGLNMSIGLGVWIWKLLPLT